MKNEVIFGSYFEGSRYRAPSDPDAEVILNPDRPDGVAPITRPVPDHLLEKPIVDTIPPGHLANLGDQYDDLPLDF